MTFKPAAWPRKLRSQTWFGGTSKDNIYHRGWMKNQGFPPDLLRGAIKKLLMLDAATFLLALRLPPSNHLEALSGDRKGQHSIRINAQWRICFVWKGSDAFDVEIVDYH